MSNILFELILSDIPPKAVSLQTEFGGPRNEIVPLLMIAIVEGIRAKDEGVITAFEILKSTVESVEMNLPLNYNVSQKSFNGKDRK